MKYITTTLTCIYTICAVATFWYAGTDPFMNVMAFICLIGAGVFAHITSRVVTFNDWPEHAVPGNVPPEEDLDEPAYIRRSYAAYRDAWNNGDERADHVSCTRLVPYTEYKAYYMHNMDECPFRG